MRYFELRMMELNRFFSEIKEWVITILVTIVLVFAIRTYIFSPVIVDGQSMMPNLEHGDRLFINKIGLQLSELQRFDVVVFQKDHEQYYIKRIIGLPGDEVRYKDGKLYINGEFIKESYLLDNEVLVTHTNDFSLTQLYSAATVPENTYFVLGDNRTNSLDSRNPRVGFVSDEQILGTSNVVVWPFERMGQVE